MWNSTELFFVLTEFSLQFLQCYLKLVHIDQEKNKGWFEKYQYDVPVIHLNGKFLMKHKVFAAALDEALKIAISSSNDKRCSCYLHFYHV